MEAAKGTKEVAAMLGRSRKHIENMCRGGRIRHCAKVDGKWAINPYAEWPELFGKEER